MAAGERRDAVAATQLARELLCAVKKLELAFDLEPPLPAGASPFGCLAARWRDPAQLAASQRPIPPSSRWKR